MMDRSKYPDNWEEISHDIRHRRAEGRCECLGECGHNHEHSIIGCNVVNVRCEARKGFPHPITGSMVVLSVAHLDYDTANNDYENLRAMCQRCHLAYDQDHHIANAARTRSRKLIEAGQLELQL